jgi:two-component system sensor histidine kinase QseC
MRSIRLTLAFGVTTVVFAGALALSSSILWWLGTKQIDKFHETIAEDLIVVASYARIWTDGVVYIAYSPNLPGGFEVGGDRAFVVRDTTGTKVIGRSPNLKERDALIAAPEGAGPNETVWFETLIPNGNTAIAATRVLPASWDWSLDDPDVRASEQVKRTRVEITVARDRTPLDRTLRELVLAAGIITLSVSTVAAAATWILAGRVLAPLKTMAQTFGELEVAAHTLPLALEGPQEIQGFASHLNALLKRMTEAEQRERRFTADAAHELRTPIAELRTLTDVALAYPGSADEIEGAVRSANEISQRLGALVAALLGIARRESFVDDLRMEPVDIPEMLRRIVQEHELTIRTRKLELEVEAPESHKVETDRALLRSIVANLTGNAVAHSPEGSLIKLFYSGGSSSFRLEVTNPAPDLDEADLVQIFEPFWRKRGARTNRDHSGLGLALSANFAKMLNMSLTPTRLASGELQMTLELR